MMEKIGGYVIRIVAAAMFSGILLTLVRSTWAKAAVRLVCGLAVTLVALGPLTKLEFQELEKSLLPQADARQWTRQGENMAREAVAQRIKEETEAYILDKAARFGFSGRVEVQLSQDPIPVPVGVYIQARVPPPVRQQMEQMLFQDLAIAKENQQWSG